MKRIARRRIFYAMSGQWQSAALVMAAADVSPGTFSTACKRLRDDGIAERRRSLLGGYEHRLTEDAKSAMCGVTTEEVERITGDVERRLREVVAQELEAIAAELRGE